MTNPISDLSNQKVLRLWTDDCLALLCLEIFSLSGEPEEIVQG